MKQRINQGNSSQEISTFKMRIQSLPLKLFNVYF